VADPAAHNTFRSPGGVTRLAQWFGLVLAGGAAWIFLVALFFRIPVSAAPVVPDHVAAVYVVGLYLLLMATAFWVWRRDSRRVALTFSGKLLAEGIGTGLIGVACIAAIGVGMGWARPMSPLHLPPVALGMAGLAAACFAVSEEALFRGFMLGLLRRDLALSAAIWCSALLFAALHFLRPVDLPSGALPFLTLTVAGALLGSARVRTGTIWFGVGLHAAWVFYFALVAHLFSGGFDAGWLGVAGLCATYGWVRWRFPCLSS
jgi:membrane protease YdiL (CAAX protease family)